MSKKSIYVSRLFPAPVMERITATYNAEINEADGLLSDADLIARAQGKDALLISPPQKIHAELLAALPSSVRAIGSFSVGLDHVDVEAVKAAGLALYNTPDVLNDSTAELGLLLMLTAARRAREGLLEVIEDRWTGMCWHSPLGTQMTGKRLGIFGMGRIGRTAARMARGFDMEIHYHNRSALPAEQADGAIYHDSLTGLAAVSDFLLILAPSTPSTRGAINAEVLAALPKGAIVTNVARGDLVVDDDLIDALGRGQVAAAGLDVYAGEPAIDPRYRSLKNAFTLPHWGSQTHEARVAMGMLVVDGLDAFFAGTEAVNRVA